MAEEDLRDVASQRRRPPVPNSDAPAPEDNPGAEFGEADEEEPPDA